MTKFNVKVFYAIQVYLNDTVPFIYLFKSVSAILWGKESFFQQAVLEQLDSPHCKNVL